MDSIEWTVDAWGAPDESAAYLEAFGAAGKLIGHGVEYPLLSVKADRLRASWLRKLKKDAKAHAYQGVSVHFGFASAWRFADGAPMPVPLCEEALSTGKKAMAQLAKAAGCPVGIENLALAFSRRDVEEQGRFIAELLRDVDGYLLLDLHNVYCQSENFGIPILDLAKTYPLARVKEIHVSGGSWSEHGSARVRRDTHDDRVPAAVLDALPAVTALCENLRFVMLERLPWSFETQSAAAGFREDFMNMKSVLRGARKAA